MLTGGCLCGTVRYEAKGVAFNSTICHCSMCRRAGGAPMVAWFSVKRDDWRIIAGEPARYASSDHATRSFCPRCGTPLAFQSSDHPDEIDITTCSLDDPAAMPPADHTRVSARLPWVRLADGLPVYAERRQDGRAPGASLTAP